MQQYGDNWSQGSPPYSPASQYHGSPLPSSNSSSNSSSRKKDKDKDKDRSDKSSRRDKGSDSSKHNKRHSSASQHSQPANSGNSSTFATPPPSNHSTPPSPTTPPTPPSPPLPPLRVDLQSRHATLNALLSAGGGEARVSAYWAVIELFLRAQLSKAELDGEVKRLVGEDSIHAHNDFFFALLQNAMSDELPTAAKGKREAREGEGAGSASKVEKGEKVKREGGEAAGKEAQKAEGKEGKKEKGKRDKSGTPLPLTPTAASTAPPSAAASIKSEDKKEGKKRKDGSAKGEKEGKRDKRKERAEEEEAMDWSEQVWPLPPPPQRWSDVSQASVHREMKHIVTASDYFAALRRERERRGGGRETDGEETGKEGGEWLWAIEESKVGYLRVRSADEEEDDSKASVGHAVALIRSRTRSKRRDVDERKEESEDGVDGARVDDGDSDQKDDPPPAWLNPASSAAYRTSALSLPAMPSLRARCLLTAKHGGLKTVSESALSLIHQAMSQYVRMLLTEMIADQAQPPTQPSSATAAQQSVNTESRSVASAMEVDTTASSSVSLPPPADSASSPSTLFSSFPASCFAPSLFTPLSSNGSVAAVKPDTDELPAADSTSLVREVSPTEATSGAAPADGAAAPAASSDAATAVKMETDASGVPPTADAAAAAVHMTDGGITDPSSIAPSAPVRSLSVSVPTSPPSLAPSSATSPVSPSLSLAERSRRVVEEQAKEDEDDARTSFPFLIARQPAYRPSAMPPPPAPSRGAPVVDMASAAVSVPRLDGVTVSRLPSAGTLSLSDFLDCLRDRRSASMRLADDLPILLERLIIVQ